MRERVRRLTTLNADTALAKRIRVLVIDDNRLVREGLRALLDEQPDLKVVATAEDRATGLRQVQELTPHIVLVDAALDNGDSFDFVDAPPQDPPLRPR